ncbi:RluA family pseudouridine synthase [Fructilactobacillus cliffordii]|uniref:Pseudouridine synthase n=1 Tax=Fructilactobacillus cliffordii TaxID=2940299 RepID=A0A9Q9E0K2_9LACO|nr:RluA family pseudouridine synthase [Fructilactobacillus cliffordii]USS89286.1 RluA family pseudouridine synthase [Fructilactobacillus cliffordii]
MQAQFQNQTEQPLSVKKILTNAGVSKRLYQATKRQQDSFAVAKTVIAPTRLIAPGETLTVTFPPETSDPEVPVSNEPLAIIFEDDNWLVINKPAGLTSVPGPSNRNDTLVNRVKGHLERAGATDLRPHVITRLDRFTSGVVLVAKHRMATGFANQMLARHQLQKEYQAVVAGHLDQEHGLIDLPIGQVGTEIARQVISAGQNAQTEYWVERKLPEATRLRVHLHTGRTHQIRVHFTHLGHPLLGDQLYGGPLDQGITRQALHASQLTFSDPFSQQLFEFKAPLPADMLKYE